MHETLKDWENGVQTRPDCMLRPTCDRVKTAYYRPTTARTRGYRLRDQLHLAARQQEIHCLDLYLLGASLLVTPVSLVTSCKKWTCPPDNHARTFDMSGEILTCLGHTDWHYFEPCLETHVGRHYNPRVHFTTNCHTSRHRLETDLQRCTNNYAKLSH